MIDTLRMDPEFSTLVSLLDASGLSEVLGGEGPYTVFAPSNEAFEALPAAVLTMLESDDVALANVLSYHVVEGEMTAEDLMEMDSVATLQGDDITVSTTFGGLPVETVVLNDTVLVTEADIETESGVIHKVDNVLVPPEE